MDFTIKRLDHLGIIAGVMKDLKVVELIDEQLIPDGQNNVTAGEAVVAMVLNGLGFANRVISLTPQFFCNKPLDLLIRKGIKEDQLNRHKLGRVLDDIADHGCEKLFNEVALKICVAEGISLSTNHNDTTTFSLQGAYENQQDDAEVLVTYGYSKAKRPDLKQIILDLCVSPDGGIPFMMGTWSGNTSDNKIMRERAKALKKSAKESHTGRTLIADAKLYTEDNIRELGSSNFITRIPATIKLQKDYIGRALKNDSWVELSNKYKCQSFNVEHYGTPMRWIVFYSQHAQDRVKKTLGKAIKKQGDCLKKELSRLTSKRFACEDDARKALDSIAKKYSYHQIEGGKTTAIERYKNPGRPAAGTQKTIDSYQIEATFDVMQTAIDCEIERRSCFVLATNVHENVFTAEDVLKQYKNQDYVEKGFAFMKAPSFFASSFFVKSTARIQAMLVVMTLALLIYTVAQRRLRKWLDQNKKTIPSQINKPLKRPTLRWIFQLLEGIDYVTLFATPGPVQKITKGLNELRVLILSCFGKTVIDIYGIALSDEAIP